MHQFSLIMAYIGTLFVNANTCKVQLTVYCSQEQFGSYCLLQVAHQCQNVLTLLLSSNIPSHVLVHGILWVKKLSCLHCSSDLSLPLLYVAVSLLKTSFLMLYCHDTSTVCKGIRYLCPLPSKDHYLFLQGQNEVRTTDLNLFAVVMV